MGGASSYLAMLRIFAFLGIAWLATKVSRLAGVSSIVLEITTGIIMGPGILGVVSEEYAVCQAKRHIACNPEDVSGKGDALSTYIAEGLPIPGDLGYIAMQEAKYHCSTFAHHHDEHGDLGHHGNVSGENGSSEHHGNVSGENGSSGNHGNVSGEHGGSGHHGNVSDGHGGHGEHGGELSEAGGHSEASEHGDHSGHGGHRRLGGGGSYGSVEECLVKSCESKISTDCQLSPDFFTLIGHTGVALMIFESGMHFDFEKAGKVGPWACVVAVLGTILPLITGALLTMAFGKPFLPDAISVGTALAPTSVGIALRLLGEAKVLQEDFGQAIITAAFVDDILSLILFNVLFSLTGEFKVMETVIYPIIGIVFMGIAMYAAVKFWPRFINGFLLPRVPGERGAKSSKKDEALFFIMVLVLVAYGTITHFLGTHLWGCFMAGMSFACISKDHWAPNVWVKQTKRITSWMIRIFFAATVAFSIPISSLLSFTAFWKGSLMGIGPCVLTKVLCAPFMGPARWVIGWAMVGRAEFAYLIAQMAAAAGMIDADTFSIVIWALLYATIFAPFIFRKVLQRYVRNHVDLASDKVEAQPEKDADDLALAQH
uniref:Cation/H+ exchanger transmembrane domain-containing protein n=1 Tax=Zooxanthella nutricula TaxID=1333877 RepID=A0A6U6SXQ2_9DINO